MNLCISGFSSASRKLYGEKHDSINYTSFCAVDTGPGSYTDNPGGKPLPAPVLNLDEIRGLIVAGELDGVCIPENNYYQVLIATMNAFRAAGIRDIYYASALGGPPQKLRCGEKRSASSKKALNISINLKYLDSYNGIYLKNLIEDIFSDVSVSCFTSPNQQIAGGSLNGLDVLNYQMVIDMFQNGKLDGVMFNQKDSPIFNQKGRSLLMENGVTCFTAPARLFHGFSLLDNDLECLFIPDKSCLDTGKVDIITTDYCNLNCQGCEQFCGLLNKRTEAFFYAYDEDAFRTDISALHRLLGDEISQISFLGGEALLNENLGALIRCAREFYPLMDIDIITNGLLLPGISRELLETIRNHNITVRVSLYEPTVAKEDEIRSTLDESGIYYYVSNKVSHFNGRISTKGGLNQEEMFALCWNKYCYTLRAGRLAHCPFSLKGDRFNVYFNECLPTYDGLDIRDSGLEKEDAMRFLQNPTLFCGYCDMNSIKRSKWALAKGAQDKSFWLSSEIDKVVNKGAKS